MRFHLAVSLTALALAGCSGGEDTAAPESTTSATETAVEATPAPAESTPAAQETQAPASEGTPEPAPTPQPATTATPAAAAEPAPAKVAAAPPAAFARCAACHSAEKGAPDKLGPNLFGVYGKKAAQGGFGFSEAFKNASLTLDDATLDKWLENPRALVPGNRMAFPGLKDPAKRSEIVAYLKQQR